MKTIQGWVIAVWVTVIAVTNAGNALAFTMSGASGPKPKVQVSKKNKRKYDPHRYSKDKHNHKAVYESI